MARDTWARLHAVRKGFRAPEDSNERVLAEMLIECQEERAGLEEKIAELEDKISAPGGPGITTLPATGGIEE